MERTIQITILLLIALCLLFLGCGGASDDADEDSGPPGEYGDDDSGSPAGRGDDDAAQDPVDAFWGEGPDEETRLALFDEIWQELADHYAAFAVKDIDWDQERSVYRTRVEAAKSHGRFFQALSDLLGNMLQDGHTWIFSEKICLDFVPADRPPVFRLYMHTSTLGACATPTDDGDLLVYRVAPYNPAGLKPGDLILGYDGKTWSQQLKAIDDLGLPVCGFFAPSPQAQEYNRMVNVVNNAHLFETLDIRRRGTKADESIPVDDLLDYANDEDRDLFNPASGLLCSEQLPVEGIEFPWTDYEDSGDPMDGAGQTMWGIIDGTNIGYIYLYSWGQSLFEDFEEAVADLMDTDGLVIDQRYNVGGYAAWEDGLALLFDEDHTHVLWHAFRDTDAEDYTALDFEQSHPGYGWRNIIADTETFYDRPIAVLQGPHAASAGDIFPYFMTYHPHSRRFGLTTHGSFGGLSPYWYTESDPYMSDLYMVYTNHTDFDSDLNYLQGTDQIPEEVVRLDPDDVAEGIDTVVQAALDWIADENGK